MVMLLAGNGSITGATSFPTAATFGSTLSVTGALTQSSGAAFSLASGQLAFPASQNSSADANTLDDYEEGTWSPTLLGSSGNPTVSYNRQQGKYVKVGTLVFISCNLYTGAISGGSGYIRVGGMPFTSGSNNAEADRSSFAMAYGSMTNSATTQPNGGLMLSGATMTEFYRKDSDSARSAITTICSCSELNTGGINIYFAGCYFTAN